MSITEFVKPGPTSQGNPQQVALRCPTCGHNGAMEAISQLSDAVSTGQVAFGHRRCPNRQCGAYVLVVYRWAVEDQILDSYPHQRIDVDPSSLPTEVLSSLQEAVDCHAIGCYRASLVMVRRTLEALCEDQRAIGATLHEQLNDVKTKLAVPTPLVDGLSDLKNLGNDATHIELRNFQSIGKEECELAIQITLELLKGVYQYDNLVNRLTAYKQSQAKGSIASH